MVILPLAHASVDDRAGLGDEALEAHHHPFARETRAARVRAVGQARPRCRVDSLPNAIVGNLLLHAHQEDGRQRGTIQRTKN